MAVSLVVPNKQILDGNGEPIVGALWWTYEAGTSTPKLTWSDQGETSPNTNPVVADDEGRVNIWVKGAYKIIVTIPGGNPAVPADVIFSADNVVSYTDIDFTGLTATIADLNSTSTNAIKKTANYSITVGDRGKTFLIDNSVGGNDITIDLPDLDSVTGKDKFKVIIKKIDDDPKVVYINAPDPKKIDSRDPYILGSKNDFVEVHFDGSNWYVVASFVKRRSVLKTGATIFTLTEDDYNTYQIIDSGTSTITLNLPLIDNIGNNFELTIKNNGGNTVVVTPSGSDAIEKLDGTITAAPLNLLELGESVTIISTENAKWRIVSYYSQQEVGDLTGDVKWSYREHITGWVKMEDKTIGNAASGATARANEDTRALFVFLWNTTGDGDCPVHPGTRGPNANADFDANKRLRLPAQAGRAMVAHGQGLDYSSDADVPQAGLTFRVHATRFGAETHTLTEAELAAHKHICYQNELPLTTRSGGSLNTTKLTVATDTSYTGGDQPHNNIQPSVTVFCHIKL
jgi:hypothetical protein